MTIEFINKRISEQDDYMWQLTCRWIQLDIEDDRYFEVYESAFEQQKYFERKKEEYDIHGRV